MIVKASLGERNIVVPRPLAPYDEIILKLVQEKGGFYNAHAHLCRADTLSGEYLRHISTTPLEASLYPLSAKQDMVGNLHHGLAYTEEDLRERMSRVLERQIAYGSTAFATCIDVTPDLPEDGMLAFRVAQELKEEFADRIAVYLAPTPIFGFKKGTKRWEAFSNSAKQADFLSALPEKDDYPDPAYHDGKIGYNAHLRKVMELACEFGKEIHFHLDQTNTPQEKGTKTLIEALEWLDQPKVVGRNQSEPTVWAIHVISPSAYSEKEFAEVIEGLLKHNIGVIICPTAALSMRPYRPIMAPTHNSIARLLDLAKAEIPIRLGTDNIADVFVPPSDGDMLTELKVLAHAIRFPTPNVLAKLTAGESLNNIDRVAVGRGLYQDKKAFREIDPNWEPAID